LEASTPNPASFVAVGDVMVDVVARAAPAIPPVHADVRVQIGGAAANASAAAAAAGADAVLVGRVGNDEAGRMLESELRARGVRPLLARDPDAATGVVVAAPAGIVANRGANASLAPADIPDPLEGDAVLVSGWALLQADTTRAGEAALDRARGEWIAVDPASARLLASFGAERFVAVTARASAVFANESEAKALTGERDPERAAEVLARRYRLACVKLGAAGAVAILDGRRERAAPQTRVEGDILGAGDAFAGTLLAALAAGLDLHAALQQACDAGADAALIR
jgi:sugar/nucleoside kinase (ribokinase family)